MLKKRLIATFVALAVLLAGWFAGVQLALAQSGDELTQKYARLAGSPANAKTLVSGLREGSDFTISGTSFKTPTGKMGNGEINIALSLAEARLKEDGIAKPSAQQLQAALIGDAKHPGILALRAEGKGWGQIAQSLGFKLGEVVRSEKADRHARAERHERPERHHKPERPERPGR